jgi:tungstate transport system substrate-binding protein
LPGYEGKMQVKGVVEIQVSAKEAAAPEPPANPNLILATTTSTQDSGLLDVLVPMFEQQTGYTVQTVAVGTGAALKMAEEGNADVLLVHAPASEKALMDAGWGKDRFLVMHNDFVIVGPAGDPAGIKGKSIKEALSAIKASPSVFVSRGDNSGTHKKELSLWAAADIQVPEKESWYLQTGQGMLATINVAAERDGYTMTDRGTYIKYEQTKQGNPPLKILVENDKALLNQYSVIAVNPKHCPKANYALASEFITWITSAKAQQAIKDFKLLGKQLFTPNAK